jgi:flagellar biosynthesis protein FliQ
VLLLSAPGLIASLVTGVLMGLLQAVTQVQDHTLSYLPKLLAVGLVLAFTGAWMGAELIGFTAQVWESIPRLVR